MVSLTLAAATSAALLAGCGSSNTANQAASTASTQAAAETSTAEAATSEAADTAATTAAASGDVQKIVVYRAAYNVADPDTDEVTKVQDAINQYLLEKGHNVQVEIHDINNAEYADKANMAWNNGEVNLMWTANWWATIGTDDLYKNKSAYDITDLLPGTDLYNAIPESYWAGCRYDGRDYYVPVYKEGAEGYKVKMLQSNLDAIGVTADEVTKAVDAADNTWDKLAALEPFMDKAVDAYTKRKQRKMQENAAPNVRAAVSADWVCSCGHTNPQESKFCGMCGAAKPADAPAAAFDPSADTAEFDVVTSGDIGSEPAAARPNDGKILYYLLIAVAFIGIIITIV